MTTLRDRFWLWGHAAGAHDTDWLHEAHGTFDWGLPTIPRSRITPVEAASYMDVPNVIMVCADGRPMAPFGQYAVPFKALDKTVWSIVGAGGHTAADEREAVLQLARDLPNLDGVIMDDFFKDAADPAAVGALTCAELAEIRESLAVGGRALDLWVVLYAHQLELPITEHLAHCDVVTFWTWCASELNDLEKNVDRLEQRAPGKRKLLGCYMWDYGAQKPMPIEAMARQCELGRQWLLEGRVEGLVFLASCICDLDIETVAWTRDWIAAQRTVLF